VNFIVREQSMSTADESLGPRSDQLQRDRQTYPATPILFPVRHKLQQVLFHDGAGKKGKPGKDLRVECRSGGLRAIGLH
jgi:hypothetical protein